MRVSLIISTYNRTDALSLVLKSVINQTVLPFEVIVADDGSGSETLDVITKFQKTFPIPLVHSWQEDEGFRQASSKNKAAAKAKGDYLIFLDGDLVMHKKFIVDNIDTAQKNYFNVNSRVMVDEPTTMAMFKQGEFSLSLSQLLKQKNFSNGMRAPFIGSFIKTKQVIKPTRGGLMAIWKEDYIAVNGMDEQFIGWGHEDSDLFIRLFKSGLKRHNNKFKAITYHLYHATVSTDNADNNKQLLDKTRNADNFRANKGIDSYL